jgi:hypothetical protein
VKAVVPLALCLTDADPLKPSGSTLNPTQVPTGIAFGMSRQIPFSEMSVQVPRTELALPCPSVHVTRATHRKGLRWWRRMSMATVYSAEAKG